DDPVGGDRLERRQNLTLTLFAPGVGEKKTDVVAAGIEHRGTGAWNGTWRRTLRPAFYAGAARPAGGRRAQRSGGGVFGRNSHSGSITQCQHSGRRALQT